MSGLRICRRCSKEKDITQFKQNGKKQGRLWTCKDCRRKKERAGYRRFYLANLEKMKIKRDKWYAANKEYSNALSREWRRENPERVKELKKRYSDKKASTIKGRLSSNMASGIYKSLKRKKNGYHWESLVGFTAEQLKKHLEAQFVDGMSWDNYGKWHIDHIIPITFFQYSSFNDVEFKMCWRLENLQPLWASDNIRKFNKVRRIA